MVEKVRAKQVVSMQAPLSTDTTRWAGGSDGLCTGLRHATFRMAPQACSHVSILDTGPRFSLLPATTTHDILALPISLSHSLAER